MRKGWLWFGIGLVWLSLASGPAARSQGTPTPLPTVSANGQWAPVVARFGEVEMVLVPPGCFRMGSTAAEVAPLNRLYSNTWYNNELPQTTLCFNAPFWLDKTEVTQAQFSRFGGVSAAQPDLSGDQRPVDKITWVEASAFCKKRGARLPTEAEWEYAARGPDGLTYPWGNTFEGEALVWGENSGQQPMAVGSKPKGQSWVGALDLSGNVWEWVSSQYQPYPYDAADGRENVSDTQALRVLRGGSAYFNLTMNFRAASRRGAVPTEWEVMGGSGIRCARPY